MLYFIAHTGTNAAPISNFNSIYNGGYYYNFLEITGLYVSNDYLYFGASTGLGNIYYLFYLDVNGNFNTIMNMQVFF